ncbi:transcriptional regulator, TetR family [Ruminococcaceae bacterium FB2012]|nr:transcriptional regulator, TetR family [Ruminococcaceae bacterium FB2012]
MKRKTTKEIIAESYLELAAKKSINKISVVDIVENCSMTKPTFYRYFKDKYDLISWLFVRATKENLDRIGTDGCAWIDTLLDGIRCYEQYRKYVVNALKHTSGRESFINIMNETEIEFIELEIKRKLGQDTVPENLSAIVKIYCYGSGQYICEWLMDSRPAPCEMVAEALEACIPDALRPFLCE